ncbi:MAG: beta-ketoacyl-ACP synthase I, partial [Pseudomonadales bacterium]|nr:beta-ketoacyl-ACP synthase I [Pseudomonadales bacterium]
MLKRVVVTGMGVVSSIGNNVEEVTNSLKEGKSGIRFQDIYAEKGFRSHVAGNIQNFETVIDRKHKRFMGDSALYTYEAMLQAIKASGLKEDQVSNLRTGLLAGSGGATTQDIVEANAILETKGIRRVGPYRVTSTMGSTVSACLATSFKIKGLNMTISSACATSAHCIGEAFEKIQWGKQDIVFAGGGEAEHYTQSVLFDAMGAFSSKYNDAP